MIRCKADRKNDQIRKIQADFLSSFTTQTYI